MNNEAKQYFDSLQRELFTVKQLCLSPIDELQQLFLTAATFWNKTKDEISYHLLGNERSEINYFKEIKPVFIAEIDYYSLLYFQAVFQPSITSQNYLPFLQMEAARYEKFINRYQEFADYMKSDSSCRDREYFTRRHRRSETFDIGGIVDFFAECTGDGMLARLLSLEKYNLFLCAKIRTILSNNLAVACDKSRKTT